MRLFHVISLATCISAYALRDNAPLNQTITAIPSPDPTPAVSPWPEETEIDTETTTQSRQLRPHPEVSVTGFDEATTTTSFFRNDHKTTLPDIGSIIQSFLTTAIPAPAPSVHTEISESGWEVVTSRFHGPHMEVSTEGFDQTTRGPNAPENRPQVTAPGAQVTSPPYVPVPVPAATPPPVITQGGVTLRPVPVTSVRVTNVDGKPATVEATVNYRYVVGSATLVPGTPMTINNVVVALSVDAAGKTVLVAGDTTTTLPAAPARAAQAPTAAVEIATTVVAGTTKYILAGQTLAPGQAITVGNIPISIGTAGASQTVLVMGDMTTTLAAGPTTTSQKERGAPSSAVTPGVGGGNGPNNPSATTRASGEASLRAAMSWRCVVASALFLCFAFAT